MLELDSLTLMVMLVTLDIQDVSLWLADVTRQVMVMSLSLILFSFSKYSKMYRPNNGCLFWKHQILSFFIVSWLWHFPFGYPISVVPWYQTTVFLVFRTTHSLWLWGRSTSKARDLSHLLVHPEPSLVKLCDKPLRTKAGDGGGDRSFWVKSFPYK